jgi:hypothetical protein
MKAAHPHVIELDHMLGVEGDDRGVSDLLHCRLHLPEAGEDAAI